MKRVQAIAAALAIGLLGSACSDAVAPKPARSAEHAPASHSVEVNSVYDIPLDDGEEIPPEFYAPSGIISTFLDVGFRPPIVYASAIMEYAANNARIDLRISLKKDGKFVDSASTRSVREDLLPGRFTITARVSLREPGPCGHWVDAKATFSVFNSFPLPKTLSLFSWGREDTDDHLSAAQTPCSESEDDSNTGIHDDGSGVDDNDDYDDEEGRGGDDYYDPFGDEDDFEDFCFFCQEWLLVWNGEVIDAWWECMEVDSSYCTFLS